MLVLIYVASCSISCGDKNADSKIQEYSKKKKKKEKKSQPNNKKKLCMFMEAAGIVINQRTIYRRAFNCHLPKRLRTVVCGDGQEVASTFLCHRPWVTAAALTIPRGYWAKERKVEHWWELLQCIPPLRATVRTNSAPLCDFYEWRLGLSINHNHEEKWFLQVILEAAEVEEGHFQEALGFGNNKDLPDLPYCM